MGLFAGTGSGLGLAMAAAVGMYVVPGTVAAAELGRFVVGYDKDTAVIVAAVGPALVYTALNLSSPGSFRGKQKELVQVLPVGAAYGAVSAGITAGIHAFIIG